MNNLLEHATVQQASIFLLLTFLFIVCAIYALLAWHRANYIPRKRAVEHPVCSPAVSRAFIKALGDWK